MKALFFVIAAMFALLAYPQQAEVLPSDDSFVKIQPLTDHFATKSSDVYRAPEVSLNEKMDLLKQQIAIETDVATLTHLKSLLRRYECAAGVESADQSIPMTQAVYMNPVAERREQ